MHQALYVYLTVPHMGLHQRHAYDWAHQCAGPLGHCQLYHCSVFGCVSLPFEQLFLARYAGWQWIPFQKGRKVGIFVSHHCYMYKGTELRLNHIE